MRKLLIGIALFFVLGGVALAWPYRSERVIGVIENDRTGCVINVQNSTGWKSDGAPSALNVERLEEPVEAGVAIYECGGVIGQRPAAMTLIDPGTGYRAEGCASSSDPHWCYARLPAPLPASGAPLRYRVLIQVRPGEPVQAVEIKVTREVTWRSASLDALMSV
ncbi:hypothetical protein OF829_03330 [Sphingomonas sp. LB-2]|uniref:hypothetical protein n=1 Tax=Sphingomonas caeni TaxID=2984949 RepID=UPI002232A8A9|nr:hypothetical protein [Sphingomonas caeni]MCW3846257.1 hypothetical protein [Sphingomonas caeni]